MRIEEGSHSKYCKIFVCLLFNKSICVSFGDTLIDLILLRISSRIVFDTEAEKSIKSTLLIFSLLIKLSKNRLTIFRFHLLIEGLPIPPSSELISFKIIASYYNHTNPQQVLHSL